MQYIGHDMAADDGRKSGSASVVDRREAAGDVGGTTVQRRRSQAQRASGSALSTRFARQCSRPFSRAVTTTGQTAYRRRLVAGPPRCWDASARGVGPGADHRVVGIAGERDLLAHQSVGMARAVPSLMLSADRRRQMRKRLPWAKRPDAGRIRYAGAFARSRATIRGRAAGEEQCRTDKRAGPRRTRWLRRGRRVSLR